MSTSSPPDCATVERMLDRIAPDWAVHECDPVAGGYHHVYRLGLDAPEGDLTAVLKATPADREPLVDTEARILRVLGVHTTIPVPTVYGVVDRHDEFPAPYLLMEALPGRAIPRTELSGLAETLLAGIARSVGQHLADLHRFDAVDRFGYVGHDTPPLDGGRPTADPDQLVVEGDDDWRAFLRDSTDSTLERVASGRFADIHDAAMSAVHAGVDELSGPFEPALAHVDATLDNQLVDPDRAEVTAMLDWQFTMATPPAYDLALVEWSLAGGHWALLPGTPDVRSTVREALLAGYRSETTDAVLADRRDHRRLYDLISLLRVMANFDPWFDDLSADERARDAAAERLRERVGGLLEG